MHRNQEGCFSFNSVYINKGKINQHKNEKIINCFPLFTNLTSILAFLCVGALPWKKIDNFLQNCWVVEFHFWRKKSASLLTPSCWCCIHKVVHSYYSELEGSFSQLFSVFVPWFKACGEAILPPNGRIFFRVTDTFLSNFFWWITVSCQYIEIICPQGFWMERFP